MVFRPLFLSTCVITRSKFITFAVNDNPGRLPNFAAAPVAAAPAPAAKFDDLPF